MPIFKKDPFGNFYVLKRFVFLFVVAPVYWRLNRINKTTITGGEILGTLPNQNVLFVSNHQTYFADVAAFMLTFFNAYNGIYNTVRNPFTAFWPRLNVYFVAAEETMESGFLPKLFSYAGAIKVKRTWREKGQEINREVDNKDVSNIQTALDNGWLITFPQGTTKPFSVGRKGTAHLIKDLKPIVIPVTIDGFRRAFDKKGLLIKKRNVELKLNFKQPLQLDYTLPVEEILNQVMHAIEQTEEHNLVAKAVSKENNDK